MSIENLGLYYIWWFKWSNSDWVFDDDGDDESIFFIILRFFVFNLVYFY